MFHKFVNSLPVELERNALYFVRIGTGFDLYVTNNLGTVINAYPLNVPDATAPIESIPLAPVVELPSMYNVSISEEWPEMVMELDSDGDLDVVVAEVN